MHFCISSLIFWLATLGNLVAGQRPEDWKSCDYYALRRYGKNDTETEYQLIQSIVTLAFAGGSRLDNASNALTGILNPGRYKNNPINLRSWFDGSKASSNFHGRPAAMNWLDGGGIEPLHDFLTGESGNVTINSDTNQ